MKKSSKKKFDDKKINKDKKKLTKSKKKFVVIGVVLVVIVASVLFLFSGEEKLKAAYLTGLSGDVKIITENGESNAKNGQELFLGDSISTQNGRADVVLLGRAIVSLEPNTEVKISSLLEDNIEIKQNSGSTWNKFLGLVGANSFKVQTPDAVASVRGTEFGVDVNANSSIALVSDGVVNFGTDNKTFDLKELEKAGVINKKLVRLNLTEEDIRKILLRKTQTIRNLKSIREEQIKNLGPLITFARKTYGLTDKDIQEKLNAIDRGELDDEKLIEKAPFKKDDLRRIKRINDEIKKTQNEIKRIKEVTNQER